MKLTTINLQGNIFTSEILEKIRNTDIRYQSPEDFNLKPNETVREEISNAWSLLHTHWQIFKQKREGLMPSESGTSETRRYWMLPFLSLLGYEINTATAEIINEKSYAISHRAINKDGFPIHIIGCEQSLDKRATHGVRLSPHALMQEYLNNTDHVYGFITNGTHLRVLRDATQLTKLSYLEFNLEQMMEEGHFPEFAILFRLLHATRIPNTKEENPESILEFYHDEALASGSRIRERLSDAFYHSMINLGTGFLQEPKNEELRERIVNGDLKAKEYYSYILRLVYRLLFLIVIEERGLIYKSDLSSEEMRIKSIYEKYYSINRLVRLAVKKHFIDLKKYDLWQSILTTFLLFENDFYGKKLNINPLGFGLFSSNAISLLRDLNLKNEVVIQVISEFSYFENEQRQKVQVNYADLNVEELGSVYEGLLSLEPAFYNKGNTHISFGFKDGMSRKESASYYTHHDLVKELMKSTLIPLIEERIGECGEDKEKMRQAILDIKVCDPSVGSGHMLLEAARLLAYHYVRVDTAMEPTPEEYRKAIRLVLQNCVYGVDMNKEAVELCKLALWLEGHNSGAPLSFLDHKIKEGNSLIGIHNPDFIAKGIPDNAYNGTTKEEKAVANSLKVRNRNFSKMKQFALDFTEKNHSYFSKLQIEYDSLQKQKQDSIEAVYAFKKKYESLRNNPETYNRWILYNLWCAPFFAEYTEEHQDKIPTSITLNDFQNNPAAVDGRIIGYANALAMENQFFHWHLEFPEVFSKGGFDVMIGNPPWERIKLQEKEFFLNRDEEILNAANAAKRKKLIAALEEKNPELYAEYEKAIKFSNDFSLFIRESNFFSLTAVGDINLYAIFAEHFYNSIRKEGRSGIVCPTGIATDNNTKDFFAEVVLKNRLISFYDFENKNQLFPIHRSFKFCLMTLGDRPKNDKIKFAFFLHQTEDIQDKNRVFELSTEDFVNINPNTKTAPVFRTQKDADLTAKVYSRLPIIHNEGLKQNLWDLNFTRQFDMTNDSNLFHLERGNNKFIPLYESKFIWFYNHRNSTFEGSNKRTSTTNVSLAHSKNPNYKIQPWYWIDRKKVEETTKEKYYLGFRNIARNTDARTAIFSLVPFSGVGNSMPLISIKRIEEKLLFLSQVSTLIFDYFVRQKLGGTNLNFNYVRQFPSLSPKTFTARDKAFILPRVAELAYPSWDIKNAFDDLWQEADDELKDLIRKQHRENGLASGGENIWNIPDWAEEYPWIEWEKEKGIPLPPFRWNEDRRIQLKAELDAYYGLLFGLEREEVAYILNPQAVMGKDFPGETFRVLKEKEIKQYGEFKTERLVLEAYDKLRPHWDMVGHLAKLKKLWEFHQEDLSEKKEPKPKKKKTQKTKQPIKQATQVREEASYYATSLFEEPNLFNQTQVVEKECKVVVQLPTKKRIPYHITKSAQGGKFTGEFKQILPSSALAELLIGKRVGDKVEFGKNVFEVVEIK